ncbi:IS5 family transposase [Archangium sp.]|uniref:IS5 family transposase n=1 Tax=Archangium sp. TaxID=1872627 RepID=UPI00389AF57F
MSDISRPDRKPYLSDLTDAQWALIEPFVRASECGPQEVLHSRREVVNAILYIAHTGAQWRYLPHDLPDWQLVYHYFDLWKKNGTLKRIHDELRVKVRKKAGRREQPTASILDSQSVKTTEEAETKGYDAGKKVKGRKRHLLVDTLGLVLVAWISTADVQDRDAVQAVLPIAAKVAKDSGITLEVVKRSDKDRGFVLQAKRWIVERTFGWLNRERRLSKDYERKEESSEAFIHLGMMRHMLRRLA